MNELINSFMPLIAILFGSGGIFFAILERGKRKAETKKSEADALDGMQEAYKRFVADYELKFASMQLELTQAQEQIRLLKKNLEEVQNKCKNCVLANS